MIWGRKKEREEGVREEERKGRREAGSQEGRERGVNKQLDIRAWSSGQGPG